MLYIEQKDRKELDPLIDQLAQKIADKAKQQGGDGAFAGLLNYVCTRLALKTARLLFGKMRYWIIAIVTGTFKNIADEFYRRVGVPYEDKKIAQSGDVDLYEEYVKDEQE